MTPMTSDSFMIRRSLPVDLDLGARPFAEQHPVPRLEIEWNELAALVPRAGPCGNDLALLRLFLECRMMMRPSSCPLLRCGG